MSRPLLALALALCACAPPEVICTADAAWISNPNPPAQVAEAEAFCDFYRFSWQWFLAETQPSDTAGGRVWEVENRVADPDGGPNQCADVTNVSGRAAVLKALEQRDNKPLAGGDLQADGNPLYDQAGNILYYSMFYSPQECLATAAGFAPGTLEIKLSWRILPAPDATYFTMPATVPGTGGTVRDVTLGLVGFHLANWTSQHPEMIWTTWEHKSNAPLCSGASRAPASGWSLTSAAGAACLTANPSVNGVLPVACASYDFNDQPAYTSSTGTPDEVCRLFESGTDSGKSINGNDNAANALAISQLNDALVGPRGLLTLLPASDPMAVWSNYQMVGALWTKDGQASGLPPVPSTQSQTGDVNSPQRGSLELTNVSLETYEQGPTSPVPNCFGCHNYVVATPLEVSHIATELLLPATP